MFTEYSVFAEYSVFTGQCQQCVLTSSQMMMLQTRPTTTWPTRRLRARPCPGTGKGHCSGATGHCTGPTGHCTGQCTGAIGHCTGPTGHCTGQCSGAIGHCTGPVLGATGSKLNALYWTPYWGHWPLAPRGS